MASMQCHKPVEQTYTYVESTVIYQTTTTETSHKANNEHSLTDKVKEMANSARKMFTEHKHHEHDGQNGGHHSLYGHHAQHGAAKNHVAVHQQSAYQGSQMHAANSAATDKKTKEGHGGNFIASIGEHMKNMTNKKNRKAGKSSDGSSDSSSEDECDKETSGEKN